MCKPILLGGWVGAVSDTGHGASCLWGDWELRIDDTHTTHSLPLVQEHTHRAGWKPRGRLKHSSFTGKKRQAAAWQSGRDCSSLLVLISIICGFRKGKKSCLGACSFPNMSIFSLTIVLTFLLMIISLDSHGDFNIFSFIFQREVHYHCGGSSALPIFKLPGASETLYSS